MHDRTKSVSLLSPRAPTRQGLLESRFESERTRSGSQGAPVRVVMRRPCKTSPKNRPNQTKCALSGGPRPFSKAARRMLRGGCSRWMVGPRNLVQKTLKEGQKEVKQCARPLRERSLASCAWVQGVTKSWTFEAVQRVRTVQKWRRRGQAMLRELLGPLPKPHSTCACHRLGRYPRAQKNGEDNRGAIAKQVMCLFPAAEVMRKMRMSGSMGPHTRSLMSGGPARHKQRGDEGPCSAETRPTRLDDDGVKSQYKRLSKMRWRNHDRSIPGAASKLGFGARNTCEKNMLFNRSGRLSGVRCLAGRRIAKGGRRLK